MITVTMFAAKHNLSRQRVLQLIASGQITPKPRKQELSGIYLLREDAAIKLKRDIDKYNLPSGKR